MKRLAVFVALLLTVTACGDDDAGGETSTTTTVVVTTTVAATTTTIPPTTTSEATTTTAPPPVLRAQIIGNWGRETEEHGSEFLRFAADGTFLYAEGNVQSLDDAPSHFGTFTVTDGEMTMFTEDCPEVAGLYQLRLINGFLQFLLIADECPERGSNLILAIYGRVSA